MGLKQFQHLAFSLMKDPALDACLPSTVGRGTSAPKIYVAETTNLGVYNYEVNNTKENDDGSAR